MHDDETYNDKMYTDDFFKNYQFYLEVPEVKGTHRQIFEMFKSLWPQNSQRNVVDLGCGTGEFGRWMMNCGDSGWSYLGIDLNVSRVDLPRTLPMIKLRRSDFRSLDFSDYTKDCNIFVSLFATEIHLSHGESRLLYDRLFADKGMAAGLVSGFYYDSAPTSPTFNEPVGYDVVQSIIPLRECESNLYKELRVECRVPPGFFEERFTEVWRIFLKKSR